MPRIGKPPWDTCRRRPSLPRGFTLSELLASSVLATMLMLAIVGLLRTTNIQSKSAERTLERHPPTAILADQIRRDFVNARYVQIRPNHVRLSGYMAQDWRTRRQTFRPAEVTYAIVANRRGASLVRQETQFSKFTGKRTRLEVLWSGAAALEVVRFDDPQEAAGSEQSAGSPPGMTLMPGHLFVAIYNGDGEVVCSQEIFHHHTVQ